jgi:SAM-dependent methyltransferase
MTYDEIDVANHISQVLEEHPLVDPTVPASLDDLDQFHIGAADAVDQLIASLHLAPGDVVLDVGSGFGGPARQIARRTGNAVVGTDITGSYVAAARQLTRRAALEHLVSFQRTDIANFQPAQRFPAAITMHVQMNVADKSAWWEQIGLRLAPGGRLAIWEVCRTGDGEPAWPMPWSLDGTDSHLADAPTLLSTIVAAGFEVDSWSNETPWVKQWLVRNFADGLPTGPGLASVLDNGPTRLLNFAAALNDDVVAVWRGSFTKATARLLGTLPRSH